MALLLCCSVWVQQRSAPHRRAGLPASQAALRPRAHRGTAVRLLAGKKTITEAATEVLAYNAALAEMAKHVGSANAEVVGETVVGQGGHEKHGK